MPKLLYLSLIRFPTEKAHGLQIAQNCEAFADAGYEVELWVARRWNRREMREVKDPYQYYGVEPNFKVSRVPVIDLYPLAFQNATLERFAFYILTLSYLLMMTLRLLFTSADVFYSRDEYILWLLAHLKSRKAIAYEAHLYSPSERGRRLQSTVVRNVGSVIAITQRLAEDLIALGAEPQRMLVAHDGIRAQRFQNTPDQAVAREKVGWGQDLFIAGFIGQLRMIGMDKGIDTLIQALEQVPDVALAIVGGPTDVALALKQEWVHRDLPEEQFLYAGQVPPDQIPTYLSAFDVCVMPHPATTQFALYTSPLKLFEYMASSRAIVASDLPAWADVLQNDVNAILVPPSEPETLAQAIRRLRDDVALRNQLATNAYAKVMGEYTWSIRAERILRHIEQA